MADFENKAGGALVCIACPVSGDLLRQGYMQQLVLPEPIAPNIAMPVKSPRSGIMPSRLVDGLRTFRMVQFADD